MNLIILEKENFTLKIDVNAGKIIFFGKENNLLSDIQPPLFRLQYRNENGTAQEITAFDAAKKRVLSEIGDTIELQFSEFKDGEFSVKVIIRADESMTYWKIETDVVNKQLEWVEFPSIAVKDTFLGAGGESKILLPYNEGVLIDDIDLRYQNEQGYTEPKYPSEGKFAMCPGMMSTPLMAVINSPMSIYFAAHDSEKNTRNIDFYRYEDGVKLQMRLYPGVDTPTYRTECETVLGVFDGDWYEAATIYRDWFEKKSTDEFTKICENHKLPDWYAESPVILAYAVRGHYDMDIMEPNKLFPYINGLSMVKEFSEKLDSPIMALLMHWEGTAPWAPPYVWPPYGGEQSLRDFADALHAEGQYVGLYCSGLGWTQTSNLLDYSMEEKFEKEHLADVMCTAPDGSLPHSKICTGQRVGYDMCPSQLFCKETIANEAEKMISSGVDYIQLLDQNHGGTPYFCYSKTHGHPPVPGKWQSDALKEIMCQIKSNPKAEKVLFGCESAAAEVFIPEFAFSDNRFELNYMLGVPVPLYAFIYHTYVNNFMGNQVCGEEIMDCHVSKDNLLYRIAYSFTAGDMLTLVITDEGKVQWSWGQRNFADDYMPDSDSAITLVKNLNAWRRSWTKKYLHTGEMIRPFVEVQCEGHAILAGKRQMRVENVLMSAYRADDNTAGQVLVNYSNQSIRCIVHSGESLTLYGDTKDKNGTVIGTETEIEIPALSAVFLCKKA